MTDNESIADDCIKYMDDPENPSTRAVVDRVATEQAIVEALEAAEKRDGWIKCSERMPKEDLAVLFVWSGDVEYGQWNSVEWVKDATDCDGDFVRAAADKVTHWQPLPDPPEEKR